MSTLRCGRYLPGHDVHYIQANRAFRGEVFDVHAEVVDGFVLVTADGETTTWWHHDPASVADALETSGGHARQRIHSILGVPVGEGREAYFYLGEGPTTCEPQADGDDLVSQLLGDGGFVVKLSSSAE